MTASTGSSARRSSLLRSAVSTAVSELDPAVVVGDPQCRGRLRQRFDEVHQPQQLGAQLDEAAARFRLVLQGAAEPEQRHRRRVRVDLDGPSGRLRIRFDVEVECVGEPCGARRARELRLSGVGGVRARLELREVAVERRLARPLTGRVVHHQGRVEGDQAVALDVRRDRGPDAGVVLRGAEVHQPARVVDDGDARGFAFAPREVEPDEVHTDTVPHLRAVSVPSQIRKLSIRDDSECPGQPVRQRRDGGDLVAGSQDRRRATAVDRRPPGAGGAWVSRCPTA